jgi:hypothetical protein
VALEIQFRLVSNVVREVVDCRVGRDDVEDEFSGEVENACAVVYQDRALIFGRCSEPAPFWRPGHVEQ